MNKERMLYGLLICTFFIAGLAYAQDPQAPIITRPGPERPEYPTPEFLPEPSEEKVLPPVPPPPTEKPDVSEVQKVFVKKIELVGNTVLTDDELAEMIRPYENREITSLELQELRHNLSFIYYKKGYVNSGVIIPDQKVDDGVIRLQVIEGVLTEINLSGQRRLRPAYVENRIKIGVGEVLNIEQLQEALSALQQNSRIKRVQAELQPGLRRGESVLNVAIEEARPYHLIIGADNTRSPSVGGEQFFVTAVHENLLGFGDTISGQYSTAEGLDDFGVSYIFPLNAYGTTLEAYYAYSESDVVEEPFNVLDINNKSEDVGLALTHPIMKYRSKGPDDSTRGVFNGSLGFEKKHNESFLLGEPFSFSAGVEDGESDVSVVRLGLDWIQRSRNQAITLGVAARIGIDAFDATINTDAPDGEFFAWQGQFQYARRIGFSDQQFLVRAFTQIAMDDLLPIEKFAVGGSDSVRGYRTNQFVRDNGVVASMEFRFPLFPDMQHKWPFRIRAAPFVDYGRSWDKDDDLPTSEAEDISSIGLGLLWDPIPDFHAEIFYGYALKDVDNPEEDLQDEGIHFRLEFKVF